MKSFESVARAFLEAVTSDLDVYSSVKGEIQKNSSTSFSLLTPAHIQFARYGRGPGKNPPLEAMLNLVNSKNILFDGLDKRGTAFAIMFAIGKNGTKNYKPNAGDFMEQTVSKYQDLYEEEISGFANIEINNQLKEEMEEYWKEQDELFKTFTM
jgi:hypothetical protein